MLNLDLLEKLCNARGISGQEEEVRKIILTELEKTNAEVKIDTLDNVLVFKKGKNPAHTKLLLTAHMDEIGFILTDIDNNGVLKFATVGGIDLKVCLGKKVLIGPDSIPGIIGVKPIHLLEKEEKAEPVSIEKMYIDIGATNKEDAQKHVVPGMGITFEPFFENNSEKIISKALDDRVGCFMLLEILKTELEFDMHFAFLTREEIGLVGAKVAAFNIEPQAALILEATTAADIPLTDENNKVCKLNEGAVISFMDKCTIYDKEYYNLALKISQQHNIKTQTKLGIYGGNDAGAIHSSKNGVRTLAISLPCRYLHTAASMISLIDLKASLELAKKLSTEIAKQPFKNSLS